MTSVELQSLLALGIPKQKAIFALKEHGNEVEVAADWCFLVRFDRGSKDGRS